MITKGLLGAISTVDRCVPHAGMSCSRYLANLLQQIKNAVRTAQALAVNEKKPLGMEHIIKVLDVAETFERDLKGGPGYVEAMRSYH